mmetsp:Transcript_8707/g.26064  ORF Transcript_8707/g.26064 Transcript_8707/m.26064 type:complete len:87 (+) Transcript_8707:662-922(+)
MPSSSDWDKKATLEEQEGMPQLRLPRKLSWQSHHQSCSFSAFARKKPDAADTVRLPHLPLFRPPPRKIRTYSGAVAASTPAHDTPP